MQNKNLSFVKPFEQDGRIVGYHVSNGTQTAPMHFSAIIDRLEARWNDIEQELAALQQWWERKSTPRTPSTVTSYARQNGALIAERRQLETLYTQLKKEMEMARRAG